MSKNSIVLDFLDKARHCETVEELSKAIQKTFEEMGFPLWAYQTEGQPLQKDYEPILVHNFPKKWETHYIENKCHEIDPVIKYGSDLTQPFMWSQISQNIILNPKELEFQDTAQSFGMQEGLAIPLIGAAGKISMISLTTDIKEKEIQQTLHEHKDKIIALSYAFHSIAKDLIQANFYHSTAPELTTREKECLLWTCKNKSAWEIGKILNISEHTVNFHLNNARKKYGVSNKFHLVVKAIADGVISV